jgi:hypothetical protein
MVQYHVYMTGYMLVTPQNKRFFHENILSQNENYILYYRSVVSSETESKRVPIYY